MKKFFGVLLILILAAAVAFLVSVVMLDDATKEENTTGLVAEADEAVGAEIAAKLSPSVVGVASMSQNRSLHEPASTQSLGSGVIVSADGYILTNHHVVGEKNRIYITLSDGRTVEGKKIWSDDSLDIAIVKADENNLLPAPLGDSATATVGESVLAIGNPLSLQFQRTVTAGIISAKDRMIKLSENNVLMEGLLQTDASINPGNSGGPLINMRGEVIGINTVKAQNAEGMGFAIAINLCKPIVERTINEGHYEMPYLGLYAYDNETATYIDGEFPSCDGLYVAQVDDKGPARIAGLRVGDMLCSIDGEPLSSMSTLREKLLSHRPDDTISLDVDRDGTKFTASIQLQEKK
ncbi:MAG: trypsin-like peptidase domain-containing protein [Clostridia bacterium]|nr:trypsin-like peptidase domain-containing protein [Clostridia bacterium]